MNTSAATVIMKIFTLGFFKENMGFLLMIFGVIFSNIFWIEPLGGHLNEEQSVYFHLIILLSFAKEPIMMFLFFSIWVVYGYRVSGFIEKQLKLDSNNFLYYSFTSLPSIVQLPYWILAVTGIFTPAILLAIGVIYAGNKYHFYLIPVAILIYLICLILALSICAVRKLNNIQKPGFSIIGTKYSSKIKKPLWSIFLFNILANCKRMFLIIKLVSGLTIGGGLYLFQDLGADLRALQFLTLVVAVNNSYLVYSLKKFEDNYLRFVKNFPESRANAQLRTGAVHFVLLVPEFLLMLYFFPHIYFLPLSIFLISWTLLFYSVAFLIKSIRIYYYWIATLFFLFTILVLAGAGWIFLLNIPIAMVCFHVCYYTSEVLKD